MVTEQGAVTEYGYDGDQRNPSLITDPEGGITRLDWAAGLLSRVTDPTGVIVRYDYDQHGDLAAVIDADGNTARLERDALGRVTAAVTPSGHRTTYVYDPVTGLLVARVNPDGGTWRYEYTTAGRLTAIVDPIGGADQHRTRPARRGDPAPSTRLGRAVTRRLDDLGNLAAVELPDGSCGGSATTPCPGWSRRLTRPAGCGDVSTTRSGHLVATLDPTGGRRGVSLDQSAGRLAVDDGDVSVVTGFDPLGRATRSAGPDGSAAMVLYDLCGRPVEALDADGGLTLIRRDPAGRPVEVTNPNGAVTRYEYDRCGRLAGVVDPLGGRTMIEYDARRAGGPADPADR